VSAGRFRPLNPGKYIGDPTNIWYRSSYEFRAMRYLDNDPGVLRWSSEEIVVPYRSPKDGRIHRYFPDVFYETARGKFLVEIKPFDLCIPPRQRKRTRKFLAEVMTYGVNMAKFEAARRYAESRGWQFKVWSEEHLGMGRRGRQ